MSLWLLLLAPPVYPQQESEEVIKISTELVTLDAEVLNKKTGQPITGLKAEDFELYEDGVRQQIGYFSQDQLPLSIALLLDVSGSVRPIIDEIRGGALNAIENLKPEDEVALMAFSERVGVVGRFSKNRNIVNSNLDKLLREAHQLGRGTAITAAIYDTATFMREHARANHRRVIIMITDNEGYKIPRDPRTDEVTLTQLYESDISVYGLIVTYDDELSRKVGIKMPRFRKGEDSVDKYADNTGGGVLATADRPFESRFREIIDRLRARYSFAYTPTNSKATRKFHEIKVKLTDVAKKRLPDCVIKTRKGYYTRAT